MVELAINPKNSKCLRWQLLGGTCRWWRFYGWQ